MRKAQVHVPALFLCAASIFVASAAARIAGAPQAPAARPASAVMPASAVTPAQLEFFEAKVRPLLVNSCFDCHTADEKGGLRLDSRESMLKGGDSGPAVVPGNPDASLLIKAVRHVEVDLHERRGDVADAAGLHVGGGGAEEAAPVEPVVLVEATVFSGEEGLSNVQRNGVDRHVDAAHDRDAAEEAVAAIEDLAPFAWPECADLTACRTSREAAGGQPGVEQHDADAGERERSERTPLSAHPDASRLPRSLEALAEHGDPIVQTAG